MNVPSTSTVQCVALFLAVSKKSSPPRLLLLLRATPAMGIALAVHLGFVLALFLLMPYSKFVHGLYRAVALWRAARERK